MNIKIDRDVRIRLNEDDAANLELVGKLEQKFKIGDMRLTLQVICESLASKSYIQSEGETITIFLSTDDRAGLFSSRPTKLGIMIDGINIQVDQWSKGKRDRFQDASKDKTV